MISHTTETSFKHLFGYINDSIYKLRPARLMTHYNCEIRSALKWTFPNIKIIGNWFNYTQVIRQNLLMHPVFVSNLKQNKSAEKLFYKYLALPLLPSEKINDAIKALKMEVNKFNNGEMLKKI